MQGDLRVESRSDAEAVFNHEISRWERRAEFRESFIADGEDNRDSLIELNVLPCAPHCEVI